MTRRVGNISRSKGLHGVTLSRQSNVCALLFVFQTAVCVWMLGVTAGAGETNGEPVETGFVFCDGRYLDAPYVVSRRGPAIFINDRMVIAPRAWPTAEASPNAGTTNPTLPKTLTISTSPFDPVLKDYLGAKTAYLRKHHSDENAAKLLGDAYRELPCVQQAVLDQVRPEILVVTWSERSVDRIRLTPLEGRRPSAVDKQSALQQIEAERENFEDRLRKGDCFFFDGGSRISFARGEAQETLPKLVEILGSAKNEATKFKEIQAAGFPMITEDSFASVVTNFSASTQLEQRVRSLRGNGGKESTK